MRENVAAIETAIQKRLEEDFSNVRILQIEIVDDFDFEGDDIMKVQVVFEGRPSDLDRRALSSSIRRVRDALSSINVSAFPSLSFVTAKDAGFSVSA
jgi:hypothetical protein